jgi:meso-butanediol dehydrogenase/(S,S)-butanediol dehydrogenase/diacetyl reductase
MEPSDYYSRENLFTGKNVIVTGAYGGIGSLVVQSLLNSGAKVMAVGRNEKKIFDKFGRYLKARSENFDYELIDLEDPQNITRGFKSMMMKLKGKLDVLILCHGQFRVGRLVDIGVDVFDSTLHVNVRACFHLISMASPFLKLTRGNVVAVSSLESKIPVRDGFLNSLSKAMLNTLIECSALELASFGVRVNAVAPAITATSHRVNNDFEERENKEYLDKMGGFFLLNKQVIYLIKFYR